MRLPAKTTPFTHSFLESKIFVSPDNQRATRTFTVGISTSKNNEGVFLVDEDNRLVIYDKIAADTPAKQRDIAKALLETKTWSDFQRALQPHVHRYRLSGNAAYDLNQMLPRYFRPPVSEENCQVLFPESKAEERLYTATCRLDIIEELLHHPRAAALGDLALQEYSSLSWNLSIYDADNFEATHVQSDPTNSHWNARWRCHLIGKKEQLFDTSMLCLKRNLTANSIPLFDEFDTAATHLIVTPDDSAVLSIFGDQHLCWGSTAEMHTALRNMDDDALVSIYRTVRHLDETLSPMGIKTQMEAQYAIVRGANEKVWETQQLSLAKNIKSSLLMIDGAFPLETQIRPRDLLGVSPYFPVDATAIHTFLHNELGVIFSRLDLAELRLSDKPEALLYEQLNSIKEHPLLTSDAFDTTLINAKIDLLSSDDPVAALHREALIFAADIHPVDRHDVVSYAAIERLNDALIEANKAIAPLVPLDTYESLTGGAPAEPSM